MFTSIRFRLVALVALFAAMVVTGRAEAQQVSVAAVDAAVSVTNNLADATFRVEVSNPGSSVIPAVFVKFADGSYLQVSNVPAEGSAKSGVETRSFDVTATPTRHLPIQVTLQYSVDGTEVEQPAILTLDIQQ